MPSADQVRRRILAIILGACSAPLMPWSRARAQGDAGLDGAGVDTGLTAFGQLSRILAGSRALAGEQATRLYQALTADTPGFPTAIQSLITLIQQRQIDPLQLQGILDREHSTLAPLPRMIASAWFLGIVGSGEHARCLAYETALNARIVADILKPPTYACGIYGSWANPPV